jgi:hypothetical protein
MRPLKMSFPINRNTKNIIDVARTLESSDIVAYLTVGTALR